MIFRSTPERIWYASGFLPEKSEEWGGLERVCKEVPKCLKQIKHSFKNGKYSQNHGSKEEYEIESYIDFFSTLFVDLSDAYKEESWMKSSELKNLKTIYDTYEEQLFNLELQRPRNLFGGGLGYLFFGALGCGSGAIGSSIIGSHYTSDSRDISLISFLGGSIGAISTMFVVPLVVYGIQESIYKFTGKKAKEENERKMIMKNFIGKIEEYISSNTDSIEKEGKNEDQS